MKKETYTGIAGVQQAHRDVVVPENTKTEAFVLSMEEKRLLDAYRSHPDKQAEVDALLHLQRTANPEDSMVEAVINTESLDGSDAYTI